ncbi:MAG: tRNA 2-thiouridine(34) synthase MnmA [Rikenellaceae bacterium]
MSTISVGVSGGIDSAATVLILKNRGYDIKGVTFKTLSDTTHDSSSILAEKLGIEIEEVDISTHFKEAIIDPFCNAYIEGLTPSPCVECNCSIKWEVIKNHALSHNATHWATGHYAQITKIDSLLYITKGVDELKDQSYYLWKLSQETLKGCVMPLGGSTKRDIIKMVSQSNIDYLTSKSESMGVCFLGKGGYKELLKNEYPDVSKLNGGLIVDRNSNILGHHEGYPFYTLAQRKGLPINKPLCVVEINRNENLIVVGERDELYSDSFFIRDYSFVAIDEAIYSRELTVKVRGIGDNPTGYCTIEILSKTQIFVRLLSDKAWALTAGQPVVFYIGDRVVGGGYIARM